ncbi:MAG TPA: PDZ domain-containing protein, partial [Anaerolineae bacterium]|nr:PDZ domain-containing protein [Anaerolineae bacterium]
GLLVIETVPGGPADQAGIRGGDHVVLIGNVRVPLGGDVIVAVNGEKISNAQELTVYLETETQVGDTVAVTVIRDGAEQVFQVTLAERPQ